MDLLEEVAIFMSFGEEFNQILEQMREISDKKNADYADNRDPFKNFRLSESMGIDAWKGVLVRLGDKYSRLCEYAAKGEYQVEDESVEDTFIDAANYAVIGLMLYREQKRLAEGIHKFEALSVMMYGDDHLSVKPNNAKVCCIEDTEEHKCNCKDRMDFKPEDYWADKPTSKRLDATPHKYKGLENLGKRGRS